VKRTAEGAYTFSLLLQVNIFRARQQSHKLSHADLRRIFDDVEEREREEREQRGCFAKQMSHMLKLRTMRLLTHHYTSSYCHATHNIPIFIL